MGSLLVVLALLQVGGSFTDPAVSGRELTAATMEVDISVTGPPGGSVAAHLIEPGGAQQTVALRERSPGRYGGIVEVRRADFVVVFEAVDLAVQSSPYRFTDIGLDLALLGALPVAPTTTPSGVSASTSRWGWLALALGAGSLALLALWALPERARRREELPDET